MTDIELESYEDGDDVYSTDMAIRWGNEYGKPKMVPVSKFKDATNQYAWIDDEGHGITPQMVVDDQDNPAYKTHVERLKAADLQYPILVHDGHIIDGFHRFTKAILQEHKKIKIVEIPDKVFKKFYVGSVKQYYKNPTTSLLNLLFEAFHKDENRMYHTILDNLYHARFPTRA
jgi:hypothetical protein